MRLVVDFNVVFSAIAKGGKPLSVFELNDLAGVFEFVSPEHMNTELDRNLDKIARFSKLSKDEIETVMGYIKEKITIIPYEEFKDKACEAAEKAPHMKDVPYVALALKYDCRVLTGDSGLKGKLGGRVITPAQAADMLTGDSGTEPD